MIEGCDGGPWPGNSASRLIGAPHGLHEALPLLKHVAVFTPCHQVDVAQPMSEQRPSIKLWESGNTTSHTIVENRRNI